MGDVADVRAFSRQRAARPSLSGPGGVGLKRAKSLSAALSVIN